MLFFKKVQLAETTNLASVGNHLRRGGSMAGSEISLRNKHPMWHFRNQRSHGVMVAVDSLSNLVTGPTIGTIQIQKDTLQHHIHSSPIWIFLNAAYFHKKNHDIKVLGWFFSQHFFVSFRQGSSCQVSWKPQRSRLPVPNVRAVPYRDLSALPMLVSWGPKRLKVVLLGCPVGS